MYEKCKEGLHPLKEISRTSDGFTDKVIRWCPNCGAIVVDMECDGRVYAGRYQKMLLPTASSAVEVVMCEGCKHFVQQYDTQTGQKLYYGICRLNSNIFHDEEVNCNHYCGYGERE